MLTLALDTATKVCSVSLVEDGKVLAEYDVAMGMTHSEGLLPQLDQLKTRTGIGREKVDRIAVSIGPGSFTGLRIGLATAEAAAYAWKCGVCGVNTLEAMAWNIPVEGVLLVPMLDAQKGNFYAAGYRWNGDAPETFRDVEMLAPADLMERLAAYEGPVLLMGECGKLDRQIQSGRLTLPENVKMAPLQVRLPKASSVGLASESLPCMEGEDIFGLRPYYIRKSEAEELWDKRHSGK